MNLLHAGPTSIWWLVAGAGISVLVVTGSFELVSRVFKLLCIALLSYIAMLFIVYVDWESVASATFLPRLSSGSSYLALLVGVLEPPSRPTVSFGRRFIASRRCAMSPRAAAGQSRLPIEAIKPRKESSGQAALMSSPAWPFRTS